MVEISPFEIYNYTVEQATINMISPEYRTKLSVSNIHSANVIYRFLIVELERLHSPELSLGIALGLDRMSHTGACPTAAEAVSIMSRLSTKEDPVIEHHEQRV